MRLLLFEMNCDNFTHFQTRPTMECFVYVQYEPKKICRRAAESGIPLRAANRRLPIPCGNGGERQIPVIFTPRAVLDPMLQTMMDPGTSLPVIPLHESQVTAARLTGGNSFRSLHMYNNLRHTLYHIIFSDECCIRYYTVVSLAIGKENAYRLSKVLHESVAWNLLRYVILRVHPIKMR